MIAHYQRPQGFENPYSTEELDELIIEDIDNLFTGLPTVWVRLHESIIDIQAGKKPIIRGFITVVANTAAEAIEAALVDGAEVTIPGEGTFTMNLSGATLR